MAVWCYEEDSEGTHSHKHFLISFLHNVMFIYINCQCFPSKELNPWQNWLNNSSQPFRCYALEEYKTISQAARAENGVSMAAYCSGIASYNSEQLFKI